MFASLTLLRKILKYSNEVDLDQCKLVSHLWTASSVDAHADFLLKAVKEGGLRHVDWIDLCNLHLWGCFTSEGTFKESTEFGIMYLALSRLGLLCEYMSNQYLWSLI